MNRYDVFLSHCNIDKPLVELLARRLKQERLEPWLDKWNLVPGDPWQPAIESALSQSAACAVFIGPSGFGPWQHEEMRAAIARRVHRHKDGILQFRVIPVLLPGADREERPLLPAFLHATTWVDFRKSIEDEEAFRRLVCGIRGLEPGPSPKDSLHYAQCPYRGLEAFQETHNNLFFGREAVTEWLLNELRPGNAGQSENHHRKENRFLAIVGPSGCGKSSLTHAGLIPALRNGELDGSTQWPVIVLRPGRDPLENLVVATIGTWVRHPSPGDIERNIRDFLESERALHLATRLSLESKSGRRMVVVVDQFEEVFTLAPSETSVASSHHQAFIQNLLYAATVPLGQTIVVLNMRADFFGKCALHPDLAAAVSAHNFLVSPLTQEEMRRAIERPAYLSNCELETGLVDSLLADVRKQPGSLPLLQHALLELWNRREGQRLTHAAYADIGKLEGALENRANKIFANFNENEKEICRRIFLRLVQPGEGVEDTKRRVKVKELLSIGERREVQAIVFTLAAEDARLLVTEGSKDQPFEAYVEVVHEALIRSWSQLRKWIESDRAGLLTHRRLTEATTEWEASKREASYLYTGARLASAYEWFEKHTDDLNAEEKEFLDASLKDDKRRNEDDLNAARERETNTLLNQMLKQFNSGCVIIGRELEILHCNDSARRLLHNSKHAAGLQFSDLPVVLGGKVYQVLRSGAALSPFRFEPAAGTKAVFQVSIVPLSSSPSAPPDSALMVIEDRTQTEQLHQLEIQTGNLRLIKSMADRLAHEIGNALVPVSTHQQLLGEQYLDPDFRASLDVALSGGVKRISRVLNQMRFLSRDVQITHTVCPLNRLIEEAFQNAQSCMLSEKRQTSKLQYKEIGKSAYVGGDRDALLQAFTEIILNALQASRDPHVQIRTRTVSRPRRAPSGGDKLWVRVTIADNGHGFDPEAAEKLLQPFYTTRTIGLGLGLVVARKIVQVHRGTLIIVPRKEGKGGLVRVFLPLAEY